MTGEILIYIGSFMLFGWGAAHLFPTKNIVMGFGEISTDNKRIITMEWIIEGISLIFIGFLTALAAYVERTSTVSRLVFWAAFGVLNVFSLVSLFTGFKNSFIVYKLCPFIFSTSSLLIIIGSIIS